MYEDDVMSSSDMKQEQYVILICLWHCSTCIYAAVRAIFKDLCGKNYVADIEFMKNFSSG
jgi:hypothetical protein